MASDKEIEIPLTADYTGLVQGLLKVQSNLKAVGTTAKESSTVLQTESKKATESTKAMNTSIEAGQKVVFDLAVALEKLQPDIFGNQVKQSELLKLSLEDISKEILNISNASVIEAAKFTQGSSLKQKALQDEIIKLSQLQQAIRDAVGPQQLKAATSALIDQTKVVQTLTNEFSKLNTGPDKAVAGTLSLRTQLIKARNEAADLIEKFGEFDPRTVAATKHLGELQFKFQELNRVAQAFSPEQKFNSVIALTRGILGGFEAVQGALGFIGVEGEAVDQTIRKVQSAFVFTQGINEVFTLGQSFKNLLSVLGFTRTAKIADTVATEAQVVAAGEATIAVEAETVATEAATVATKSFTASLLTNPFTVIAAALAVIVGLVYAYSQGTDVAISKQIEQNKLDQERFKLSLELQELLNKNANDRIIAGEQEIGLLSAQGAASEVILKKEQQLAMQRASLAKATIADLGLTKQKIGELETSYSNAIGVLIALRERAALDPKDKTLEKQVEAQQGFTELLKTSLDAANRLWKQYQTEVVTGEEKAAELRKKIREDELNAQKTFAEARLLIDKVGSSQRLKDEIAVADAEKKIALASLQEQLTSIRNNSALQGKERIAAEQNIQSQITKVINENVSKVTALKREATAREIDDQRAFDEAKLINIKKDSQEELDLKLKILDETASAEVERAGTDEKKKQEIIIKSVNSGNELIRQFNESAAKREAAFEQQSTDLRLAIVRQSTQEELSLKIDAIKEKATLDILDESNSTHTFEEKTERIRLINAKADKDALDTKRKFNIDIINLEERLAIDQIELQQNQGTSPAQFEKNKQVAILEAQIKGAEQRRQQIIDDDSLQSKVEIADAENNINKLKQALGKKKAEIVPIRFSDLFHLTGPDAEHQAELINQAGDSLIQSAKSIASSILASQLDEVAARQAANQQIITDLQSRIDQTESELQREEGLQKQGLANSVETKRKELEQLNAQKTKALQDEENLLKRKRELAKQQAIIDSITQASSLLSAGATLFSKGAFEGPAGILTAIATIAAMIAAFLSLKAKIGAANEPLEKGGTIELNKKSGTIKGRRHSQGGHRIEGTNYEVEDGEEFINRVSSAKHRKMLKAINREDLSEITVDDLKQLPKLRTQVMKQLLLDAEQQSQRKEHLSKWDSMLELMPNVRLIRDAIRGTGISLQELTETPGILSADKQHLVLMNAYHNSSHTDVDLTPLMSEVKGLRKDLKNKKQIHVMPNGDVIEVEGNHTRITKTQ